VLFERFIWEEEYLGLISGISFVLIGVFAYAIYLLSVSYIILGLITGAMCTSALTALMFQLPRIKEVKPGVSTFAGGLLLGVTVLIWAIVSSLTSGEFLRRVELSGIAGILAILSFFAVGFLILALYPPGMRGLSNAHVAPSREERKKEKKDDIEDIIERL